MGDRGIWARLLLVHAQHLTHVSALLVAPWRRIERVSPGQRATSSAVVKSRDRRRPFSSSRRSISLGKGAVASVTT